MSEDKFAVPPSPGVGARRKHAPKLPLSAFSGTKSSNTGQFPSPPSPSTLHPAAIVDARVATNAVADLVTWTNDTGAELGSKLDGIIVTITSSSSSETTLEQLKDTSLTIPIIAVSLPFPLSQGPPASMPAYTSNSSFPIALSTPVTSTTITPEFIEGVRWALGAGHVVELDVQTATGDGDEGWEYLEELIEKAQQTQDAETQTQLKKRGIIITNVLPPPSRLDLPVVKLLTHPGYLAYQSHVASLSLLPNTYLKFIPPNWASDDSDGTLSETLHKEWKRRVKMYLGPAVEAFGDSRIIYGSSPSSSEVKIKVRSNEWYALAREAVAELGVEQEGVDAIFSGNARSVYTA